ILIFNKLLIHLLPHTALTFPFSSTSPTINLPSFPTRRSSDLLSSGRQPLTFTAMGVDDASGIADLVIWFAKPINYAFSPTGASRSEEHTSELQSQSNLVCRLLLEKKNTTMILSSKDTTM